MSNEEEIDQGKRRFLLTASCALGGIGLGFAVTPFIASWWPSARAQAAGAPVEVDISQLESGQMVIIEWRGSPVWILRRSQQTLKSLTENLNRLRDPGSNINQQPDYAKNVYRSRNPDYLVLVGICTHLGCSPKYCPGVGETVADWPDYCPSLVDIGEGWPGGFYCPCHGSKFDLAGRVYKGVPAPINLAVPPYMFVDDKTIIIGVDENKPVEV